MSSKSRPCTAAHSFIAIKRVASFWIRATSEFAEKRAKKTQQCAGNTDSTLKFVESLGLIVWCSISSRKTFLTDALHLPGVPGLRGRNCLAPRSAKILCSGDWCSHVFAMF